MTNFGHFQPDHPVLIASLFSFLIISPLLLRVFVPFMGLFSPVWWVLYSSLSKVPYMGFALLYGEYVAFRCLRTSSLVALLGDLLWNAKDLIYKMELSSKEKMTAMNMGTSTMNGAMTPNCSLHITKTKEQCLRMILVHLLEEFGVTLMLYRTPYLVDMVNEKVGRVLKIDSMRNGNVWKGMDMLIFNSWHWWTHTGDDQPWDYIQEGNKYYRYMNPMIAYYKGLTTWARWINRNVNPAKTKVFFVGISPSHYEGSDWNEPTKSCSSQTQPFAGTRYPGGMPLAWVVVEKVFSRIRKPAYWLDITMLSQYRKDAHPSVYSGTHKGRDCSHWCLPGLPDTWNQLLYAALFH